MATPKKKHLIELMIEAGVKWPDGAEYAAQNKRDLKVQFYKHGKPIRLGFYRDSWVDKHKSSVWLGMDHEVTLPSLCRNWHQTIVTREQYADYSEVVPVWNDSVGELLHEAQSSQVRESEDIPAVYAAEWHSTPSIEQLTADYHAKAAEADRLQAVADEALKAADEALLALEKAGELIGLVISIDTNQKLVDQPNITDWRDLRVGDVIEYVQGTVDSRIGMQGVVEEIDFDDADFPIRVMIDGELWWCNKFRFIRRP